MAFQFTYAERQNTIYYDNQELHSLLELKFLLTIEESHAWLRDGLEIYFEEETYASTLLIKEGTRKYTPDFLIRDYYSGKATLVEIKPEGYDHYRRLSKYKTISENFIREFEYDWEFKVIFSNEIILTTGQRNKFEQIVGYNRRPQFDKYCDNQPPSCNPHQLTLSQYVNFVRSGIVPTPVP